MNAKEKIKDLIAKALLKDALQCFRDETLQDADMQSKIIGLTGQMNHAENEHLAGRLIDDKYGAERSRISTAILAFLNDWETNDHFDTLPSTTLKSKPKVVKVFICHAKNDAHHLKEFRNQLNEIADIEVSDCIDLFDNALEFTIDIGEKDIVISLLTPQYLTFIGHGEGDMLQALIAREVDEKKILYIPVLVEPCSYKDNSYFKKVQEVKNAQFPISYADIVHDIYETHIACLQRKEQVLRKKMMPLLKESLYHFDFKLQKNKVKEHLNILGKKKMAELDDPMHLFFVKGHWQCGHALFMQSLLSLHLHDTFGQAVTIPMSCSDFARPKDERSIWQQVVKSLGYGYSMSNIPNNLLLSSNSLMIANHLVDVLKTKPIIFKFNKIDFVREETLAVINLIWQTLYVHLFKKKADIKHPIYFFLLDQNAQGCAYEEQDFKKDCQEKAVIDKKNIFLLPPFQALTKADIHRWCDYMDETHTLLDMSTYIKPDKLFKDAETTKHAKQIIEEILEDIKDFSSDLHDNYTRISFLNTFFDEIYTDDSI